LDTLEKSQSAGSWDVHVHAVPAEIQRVARANLFDMRVDGEAIWVKAQRLLVSNMLDGQGIRRDRDILANHLVISIPPALIRYDLNENDAKSWTTIVNDGMAQLCSSLQQTCAFAYLPLHHPELAVLEIEKRRGFPWVGYVIGTTVGDRLLDDEQFQMVFAALTKVKGFVFVHPLQSPDKRLGAYYLENLMGNPVETGLAAASLLFSGRLSEYPEIKFCLAHGGGVTAHLVGRWQHGYETGRPGIRKLPLAPIEAVRKLYVDPIVHDAGALQLCLRIFGEDHVLPGSDYPFPMGEKMEHATLQTLPSDLKDLIIYRNVPELLAHCGLQTEAKKNP